MDGTGVWLLLIAEQKSALELACRIDGLLSPSWILEEEFNGRNRSFCLLGERVCMQMAASVLGALIQVLTAL